MVICPNLHPPQRGLLGKTRSRLSPVKRVAEPHFHNGLVYSISPPSMAISRSADKSTFCAFWQSEVRTSKTRSHFLTDVGVTKDGNPVLHRLIVVVFKLFLNITFIFADVFITFAFLQESQKGIGTYISRVKTRKRSLIIRTG